MRASCEVALLFSDSNVNQFVNSKVGNSTIPSELGQTITGALTNIPFRFGIDSNGDYGYYKVGADSVSPFKSGLTNYLLYHDSGHPKSSTYTLQSDYQIVQLMLASSNNTSSVTASLSCTGLHNVINDYSYSTDGKVHHRFNYGYVENAKSGLVISYSGHWEFSFVVVGWK